MARLQMYSVHDVKVGAFMPPFYARSRGEAIRSFTDAVKDPQSALSKHPGDYRLTFCGEFDESTCVLHPSLTGIEYVIGGEEIGE